MISLGGEIVCDKTASSGASPYVAKASVVEGVYTGRSSFTASEKSSLVIATCTSTLPVVCVLAAKVTYIFVNHCYLRKLFLSPLCADQHLIQK